MREIALSDADEGSGNRKEFKEGGLSEDDVDKGGSNQARLAFGTWELIERVII